MGQVGDPAPPNDLSQLKGLGNDVLKDVLGIKDKVFDDDAKDCIGVGTDKRLNNRVICENIVTF